LHTGGALKTHRGSTSCPHNGISSDMTIAWTKLDANKIADVVVLIACAPSCLQGTLLDTNKACTKLAANNKADWQAPNTAAKHLFFTYLEI